MPYSHHSHSGQFCPGHARDRLEEVVGAALSKRMEVLALTEHMPRHDDDRYPEEVEAGMTFASYHLENERAYFAEATRLRQVHRGRIEVLVGFEGEWIRPRESADLVRRSIATYHPDFFVGSVHHVHAVPIDYDGEMYDRARKVAGGTDERLFEDYFDAQLDMLRTLQPPVVGHFDLIRLKSDDPDASFRGMKGVWERILDNLDYIASYGGVLEINSAGLRKGMAEPYPKAEICQAALDRKIRFCLSDDSHGCDQVATNYSRVLSFLDTTGISQLTYLKRGGGNSVPSSSSSSSSSPAVPPTSATGVVTLVDERFPDLRFETVEVKDIRGHPFWSLL